MPALMVQHGCDAALEILPADMEVREKTSWMKKAYSSLILCLGDQENFVETLLHGKESLTIEDVLVTLNSRDLKKRTEGTKEETSNELYVKGRLDYPGKTHSGRSSWFKSRGETGKLKCFICHSKGHLERDCPIKKSSGFVKKGKRDQDSNSSDDEGNAYFGEALVVVENDEMTELVMDSSGSYHMTHMRDFLYDFWVVDGGSLHLGDNRTCTIKGTRKLMIQLHDGSIFIPEDVKYVPWLKRSLISLGTLKKEGYTMKMHMGKIKVIKGCWVMMTGIKKKNYVYTLEEKVTTFGIQNHGGSKQVGFKQLGSKQVGFKQFGPGVETRVHVVQIENCVWFKVELQGGQGDRKGAGKGTPWYKGGANIMVAKVLGQEGAKGNVAKKKKVKKFMEANLGKLLKYNAWSIRWSSVRGSNMRKRC
ncbi:zinc finger, CCHC-type containing protein [Tanacetum coccineum]